MTSEQIRACRAVLRWSIEELAQKSGVSSSTLKRIESNDGFPNCRIDTIERIRVTFENSEAIHLPDSKTIILLSEEPGI